MNQITINPIKALRLSWGLTQEDLAFDAKVSRNLVVRNEYAVYQSPSPKLVHYFLNPDNTPVGEFEQLQIEYENYQKLTRQTSYGRLIEPIPIDNWPYEAHPWIQWRTVSKLSINQIQKLYCVHPAILSKFENQPQLMNTIPGQLRDALLESGYKESTLDNLQLLYDEYKDRLVG